MEYKLLGGRNKSCGVEKMMSSHSLQGSFFRKGWRTVDVTVVCVVDVWADPGQKHTFQEEEA